MSSLRTYCLLVVAATWVAAPPAPAQEPPQDEPPEGLESITVTARKVEEDLQSTPVSISAFTSADLDDNSVYEVKDLGVMTSNMRFENVPGTGSTATITIRGISQADLLITGDPSVGVYIDGVYNARIIGANFNLLDVERVEVLKGPQGTLYGKNTPAGALLIHSKKPDGTFGGWAKGILGDDGRTDAQAAIQFPLLGEGLSFRLAVQSEHRDGNIDNKGASIPQSTMGIAPILSTGDARDDSNRGARGTLRWLPNEAIEVVARGYYFDQRSNVANPHILSEVQPVPGLLDTSPVVNLGLIDPVVHAQIAAASDNETTFLNFAGREEVSYDGASLNASYDVTDNLQLKYIGGYRAYTARRSTDSDGTPFPLFEVRPDNPTREKSRQASHELTLSGLALEQRFNWQSGVYFFTERSSTRNTSVFGTFAPGTEFHSFSKLVSRIRSWGAYGQGTYNLTDKLSTTLGIRTTYERRRMDHDFASIIPRFGVNIPGSVRGLKDRWNRVTWLAGLEYQITDELFGYVKASTGFRSGGFNGRGRNLIGAAPFTEENVTSYEGGVKAEWLDRRVRTNLSVFFSKYKGIQTTALVPSPSGIETVIENSGSAAVSGFEFEWFTRLIPGLDLLGTVAYTNFRYTAGIFSGGPQIFNPLLMPDPVEQTSRAYPSNAPKFTYSISAQYTLPEFDFGVLAVRADWAFQSDNEASGTRIGRDHQRLPAAAFTDNVRQNQYGTMNARISLALPQFNTKLAVFARNLFDREYFAGAVDWAGSGFGYWTKNWAPGRKFGFEATYYFGSEEMN